MGIYPLIATLFKVDALGFPKKNLNVTTKIFALPNIYSKCFTVRFSETSYIAKFLKFVVFKVILILNFCGKSFKAQ